MKKLSYDRVDEILDRYNKKHDLYGVESIRDERFWVNKYYTETIILFANTGEAYDTTLCYSTLDEKFYFTSWGDLLESLEKSLVIVDND